MGQSRISTELERQKLEFYGLADDWWPTTWVTAAYWLTMVAAITGRGSGASFPNISGSHVLFAPFTMEPEQGALPTPVWLKTVHA